MADKRDIRRIKKRITINFSDDKVVKVGFTQDISMIGMFIHTPYVLPPNSKIKIKIILPEGDVVELMAVVMWAKKVPPNLFHLAKKSGMGVRFLRFNSGEEVFDKYFDKIATPL
ncbi:MAG: pilus assembly protein PilZ [Geobacteraceae bacterium]|nr:pilus assembly protein PilZ [Geobacteraceae bacterium]NTW79983.1 pilus assembly protein PilZ [Geobacteraceae bacterium]